MSRHFNRYIPSWGHPPIGIPAMLMDLWDAVDKGSNDVLSLYHECIVRLGCDTVTSWLPSSILDKIDSIEYDLQRGH